MFQIEITNRYTIDRRDHHAGKLKNIIILTEEDLEIDRLTQIFCGQDCDLILTPRNLSGEHLRIVQTATEAGDKQVGKIKVYK